MSIAIEAIYENGLQRPTQLLPFQEHERVWIIEQKGPQVSNLTADEAERAVRRSYGLLGWTGDVQTLRRIAEDPEFSLWECS